MYEELAYKDGRLLINLILLRCMRLHQSSNGAVCHQRAFCALPAEMPGLHAVTVGPLQNGEKARRVWLFGQRPVLFVLGNTDQFISRFPCSMPPASAASTCRSTYSFVVAGAARHRNRISHAYRESGVEV
jgi:hypothetical protein